MLTGFIIGVLLAVPFVVAGQIFWGREAGRRSRAELHQQYARKVKASYELGRIAGRNELRLELLQHRLMNLHKDTTDE